MPERIGRIFAAPDELQAGVARLGRDVLAAGPADLLCVTLLHGGLWFLADLVRRLAPAATVDFLRLSPYPSGENPPGSARILKDLDHPVAGRHVLVVEDVVDTGLSLAFLLRRLETAEPASLRICTLLDRSSQRLVDLPIAHRGFEIDKEYLVGYGLDVFGYYRNLPCLVAVDDLDSLRADPLSLVPQLREWGIWGVGPSARGDSL